MTNVGAQLYTVRALFADDFRRTLKRLNAIGYRDVELHNLEGHAASEVKVALNQLGMTCSAMHVALGDLESNWQQVLADMEVLQPDFLVLAWLEPEDRSTIQQYRRHLSLLHKRAIELQGTGVRILYHNHDFEFQPIQDQQPYKVLLDESDPSLLNFELDLYWASFAGANLLDMFEQYAGRFLVGHLKDMLDSRSMGSVGSGNINFNSIFEAQKLAGFERFFVEHDDPIDPLNSLALSHRYLTLGGVLK